MYICIESWRLRVSQPFKQYQENIPEGGESLEDPRNEKGGHCVLTTEAWWAKAGRGERCEMGGRVEEDPDHQGLWEPDNELEV